MKGLFVTFEGIDGAGKSTHLEPAAAWLRARGREVVVTREPGGTPLGEQLRELMLHSAMSGTGEALLAFAARGEHLARVIEPALQRGAAVVCDRFSDATFAYQGGGRGVDAALLRTLEASVQRGLQPDLTLWFDLAPEIAAERRARARSADRFEAEDVRFFERVRGGYRQRMAEAPARFVRIDAVGETASVWANVEAALAARVEMPA